ncbi:TLC domain-containing protein [Debaryomyces fabryi]|uniref:TLC domain-containing protein n=1 Tax=Debaryomyces fabryi TaxID=58627 RepID=A0A0V1Q5W2_9ASCO|nr:TLC domain-containing protein [Debaryomyces fabryi]KSA03905.1 TLC domain-containing protein [Debaryomyces fabryi]CUM48793.1 unnamed protein product [Debaryomyces fabryi]
MTLSDFLPVFNEDPLLKFRPFPETTTIPLFAHWHEIMGSFLMYVMIQKLSPMVSSRLFGKSYTQLNFKTKTNFDIHVVSMVQCVISILALIPMWNHPTWKNRITDPASAVLVYYPYGGFVSSITVGYFVWDLVVCFKYMNLFGVGFLVHAVSALVVFGSTLAPFCIPWVPAFLIFELSTPFVNVNWFASKMPAGFISDEVAVVNGILLLVTFFTVRILWGFYAVVAVARDMFAVWDQLYKVMPIVTLFLNATLDLLNVYWFYKMLLIAKKKASGRKSTKEVEKELAHKLE